MKETQFTRHRNIVLPMRLENDRKATLQAINIDAVCMRCHVLVFVWFAADVCLSASMLFRYEHIMFVLSWARVRRVVQGGGGELTLLYTK